MVEAPLAIRSEDGQGWGQHGPQNPWLAARQAIHEAALKRYAACLSGLIVLFMVIHWLRFGAVKSRWTRARVLSPFVQLSRFVHKQNQLLSGMLIAHILQSCEKFIHTWDSWIYVRRTCYTRSRLCCPEHHIPTIWY